MSYRARPSELPRVLQDTPEPSNGAGLNHTGGFFSGVFPGWQEQSSNTPRLERGGLWAEQGAQRGFGGAEGHTLGFSRV